MTDSSRDEQAKANGADQRETVNSANNAADPVNAGAATGPKPADGAKPVNGAESAGNDAQTRPVENSMEVQLSEAQAKAAEYLDGWQRARAEFANYRKRADQERAEAYGNASVDTLRKILPVIDDFDRAISNVPPDKANDEVIKGFNLIHRKLSNLLEGAGITVINPVGEEFNPKYHEAIGTDESSDVPSGHVTAVLQKGYLYGDKVLRPALVRVAG